MPDSAAIEIDSLTKRYGRLYAVDGVSFTVERGAVHGLLGPNGSGKTTTLECALGLQRPTRGTVHVLGAPARRLDRIRGRVAAVFDRPPFVEGLTVEQNLEYARRSTPISRREGRGINEALELVGAAKLAHRRAGKLSLGQRKLVALARALLGTPELVVLDEPLSGLDAFGVRRMLALLRTLADEGITLLLSSHRLREMESVVTHVGVLSKGKLVREGSLAEVLERQGMQQVHVRGVAIAERVLQGIPGLRGFRRSDTGDDTALFDVRPGEVLPEELNRRLVEAGSSVTGLVSSSGTLEAIFDELLRQEKGERG